MIIFILLFATHLFVLAVFRFTFGLYGKANKNVILETTLADEYLDNEQVKKISQRYLKHLNYFCLIFAFLGLPLIFIPYDSLSMMYFFVILILEMIGYQYLLIINISQMQQLKMANNWLIEPTNQLKVRADTKLSLEKNRKLSSPWWFLPPGVFFLGQVIFSFVSQRDNLLLSIIMLLTFSLSCFMYYSVMRLPAKVLSPDQAVNAYCNDLNKQTWSRLTILISYFLFAMQLIMFAALYLQNFSLTLMSWLIVALVFIFLGLTVYLLFGSRRKQNAALNQAEKYYYEEVDAAWKYGIYYNPTDPNLLVQDRIGMNLSFNLGHKVAKSLTAVIAVLIVGGLGVLFTMMLRADFATNSFLMTFEDDHLTLSAPLTKTNHVPYAEIEKVELLKEEPEAIRVNGTGTANYATGKFKVSGEKNHAHFYLDRRSKSIIKITTHEKNYYFSQRENTETQGNFDKLSKKIN